MPVTTIPSQISSNMYVTLKLTDVENGQTVTPGSTNGNIVYTNDNGVVKCNEMSNGKSLESTFNFQKTSNTSQPNEYVMRSQKLDRWCSVQQYNGEHRIVCDKTSQDEGDVFTISGTGTNYRAILSKDSKNCARSTLGTGNLVCNSDSKAMEFKLFPQWRYPNLPANSAMGTSAPAPTPPAPAPAPAPAPPAPNPSSCLNAREALPDGTPWTWGVDGGQPLCCSGRELFGRCM